MSDFDIAKALFGSDTEPSKVEYIYGIAMGDSVNGEVLIQLDDEIVDFDTEDEEELYEVDLEADDDIKGDINEDTEAEELGEDDDEDDAASEEEINEIDDDEYDSTDEFDDGEEVE